MIRISRQELKRLPRLADLPVNNATILKLLEREPFESIMKCDGRTFDHQTLGAIRLMAVERVRKGELASRVVEGYGINRTTIDVWISGYKRSCGAAVGRSRN